MKLNRKKLRQIILEELSEQAPTIVIDDSDDPSTLVNRAKSKTIEWITKTDGGLLDTLGFGSKPHQSKINDNVIKQIQAALKAAGDNLANQ